MTYSRRDTYRFLVTAAFAVAASFSLAACSGSSSSNDTSPTETDQTSTSNIPDSVTCSGSTWSFEKSKQKAAKQQRIATFMAENWQDLQDKSVAEMDQLYRTCLGKYLEI